MHLAPFKIAAATTLAIGLAFLATQPLRADPMKCTGEEKTCTTDCVRAARTQLSVCLTGCGARKSKCLKTGCWDNGVQVYCGLAKQ